MSFPEQSTVLSSWKDIARYMGKGVRTVQRWERELGLPVRRPNGVSQKSAVMLNRSELDFWLQTRFSARASEKRLPDEDRTRSSRAALRENIRKAHELRAANLELTRQISQSLRRLTEQCDALSSPGKQIPVAPIHMPSTACAVVEASSLGTGPVRVA